MTTDRKILSTRYRDPIIQTLRAERQRLGLSQTAVGLLLGRKSYGTIYQWEAGVNAPNLDNLRAWANVLGYDVVLTPQVDRTAW